MRSLLAMASALALAACAAGPDYVRPQTTASAAAPFIGSSSALVTAAEPEGDWWRLYRDPVLDQLVADALAANTDIRVAVARLERARATLRGVRSDRLPSTGINAASRLSPVSRCMKLERPEMSMSWLTCARWARTKSIASLGCCCATAVIMPALSVFPGSVVRARSSVRRASASSFALPSSW